MDVCQSFVESFRVVSKFEVLELQLKDEVEGEV